MKRLLLTLCAALVVGPLAAAADEVHLIPEDKAAWTPGRMFGFLRPGHNYGDRQIEVETTPSDAVVDLYYVRAGFQKRYEQADAPVTVVLPTRSASTSRDTVTIRASAEGWKAKEVTLRVQGKEDKVLLELDPLANMLFAVSHSYFGGRGSVSFQTKEAPQVRLQKGARSFQVSLAETARGEALEQSFSQVKSPLVGGLGSQQVGDDLLVRVVLAPGVTASDIEMRSRQSHDPIGDRYLFSLDFLPVDGGERSVEEARAALKRIARGDVSGCALDFDSALRSRLDAADLARSLAPSGSFTDPYLRSAMRRLGEVSEGGRIVLLDGSQYAPSKPLELAAAMTEASQARGFLALLRRFVDLLEPEAQRTVAFRSLVAPGVGAAEFVEMLSAAEAAEAACPSRSR
ncbi:MAG: hypothetical protein JRH10_04300 [Deltaproteobacteria bacterium]|nr:hypothetical protein [Deltaproteobacteria bacterium]MBW2444313.1 hypothetical protein [Deltaproteobacteria bacterium]